LYLNVYVSYGMIDINDFNSPPTKKSGVSSIDRIASNNSSLLFSNVYSKFNGTFSIAYYFDEKFVSYIFNGISIKVKVGD
jgi:hypothetical protein